MFGAYTHREWSSDSHLSSARTASRDARSRRELSINQVVAKVYYSSLVRTAQTNRESYKTMEETNADSETRVDLYLRPGGRSLWSHQQDVVDRVERLATDEVVDYHRIQYWPREVSLAGPMSDTTYHRTVVETTDEFREWGDEADRPVYDMQREVVESGMTGERHDVLRLPACCMAVYEDDELVGVYPHVDGSTVVTVEDAVSWLEEVGVIGEDGTRTPSPAASNSN